MNRLMDARLRRLKDQGNEKPVKYNFVRDQAEADRVLAEYKGKDQPTLVHWQW